MKVGHPSGTVEVNGKIRSYSQGPTPKDINETGKRTDDKGSKTNSENI